MEKPYGISMKSLFTISLSGAFLEIHTVVVLLTKISKRVSIIA